MLDELKNIIELKKHTEMLEAPKEQSSLNNSKGVSFQEKVAILQAGEK